MTIRMFFPAREEARYRARPSWELWVMVLFLTHVFAKPLSPANRVRLNAAQAVLKERKA